MEQDQAPDMSRPQQPPKKDFFSTFGKLAAIVIVAALLVGGGVYLGQNMNKSSVPPSASPVPEISSVPSPTTGQVTTAPTASQESGKLTKTVTAGGAKGTAFGVYAIDFPQDWTETKEKNELTDKLTLSKGLYSLTIYQAPMGGGGCLYPGDADSPMAQKFTDFVNITGAEFSLRRSWNKTGNPAGTIGYTVCQKGQDNSYGSITSYGAISVKSPDPSDPKIMAEIDSILTSVVKK
jgi:hypothetical protein